MLSLHDQNRGPWILLNVALDKGRFNMTVCGRYTHCIILLIYHRTKIVKKTTLFVIRIGSIP
jgi:hypothetical protein